MKDLAAALAKAQLTIKSALKDTKGQIGQNRNYKYADLTSVWDACRSSLSENGIAVIQKTDFDGSAMWVETVLLHSSGDMMSGRFPLRPTQETPQAYGSALTYARRYSLASMVGVVTEDDDGSEASGNRQERQETTASAPVLLPKPADKGKAAETYVYSAIKTIGTMTNPHDIDAWYASETEKIAKLKLGYPDQFRELMAGITAQRQAVSKVAAE